MTRKDNYSKTRNASVKIRVFRFTVIFSIFCLLIMILLSQSALGQGSAGPKTISGQVYKSNGRVVDDKYDGTHIELHIIHGGEESIHLDYNGIETGWYSITIDAGDWSQGDLYWIVVDGTPWGDLMGRAEHNNVTEWLMVGPGSHQLDIKSVAPKTEVESEVVNIEPEIAILCGLIILVFGMFISGPMKKVDVDVIVLSRKLESANTASKDSRNFVYEFGYGNPAAPLNIGKMKGLDEHLAPNSVVRVRTRSVVSTPNGTYSWHKPELLGLDRSDQSPLLAPDTVTDLDKLWYASGSIKADRGQSIASAVRSKFLSTFGGLVLPFIILEFLIGFYSFFYEYPKIPPFFGEALIINVAVLVSGIVLPLVAVSYIGRAKKYVERSKSAQLTLRQWVILKPGSKHAQSSTSTSRRVDFCASCNSQVTQTSTSCHNCGRSFSSSIEITPAEGEKLLAHTGSSAPQEQAAPQTSVPAQPLTKAQVGQPTGAAQTSQPVQPAQPTQPAQPATTAQPQLPPKT